MGKYVAYFDKVGLEDLVQVGGKGANLGELARAGFLVPPGFCIRSICYEAVLHTNNIGDRIQQIAASIDFSSLEDVENSSARIREMILEVEIPAAIVAEITVAYEKLQGNNTPPLVAVRSSVGTKDLTRSSFPGQMDTFHNVRGLGEVLAHIKECWASVWTARAAASINAKKIPHHEVIIAPVVQLMVPSEVAGVLFTANPINASRDEMMINAAYGLGEAVVSGSLTPDQYLISKNPLDILSAEMGCKHFKLEFDAEKGSGNRRVEVPQAEANGACLQPRQVQELAEMGLRVEEYYGEAQDVEWAYCEGLLYVLQSRPITGLDRVEETAPGKWIPEFDTKIKAPPDKYTSANISEVLPGVLTPISLSGIKSVDYGFWKSNYDLGFISDPFPEGEFDLMFTGIFYGRAHLNITAFNRMLSKIPGTSTTELDRPIPLDETAQEFESPGFSLRLIPSLIRIISKTLRMRRQTPGELERLTAQVRERIAGANSVDISRMELEDFAQWGDQHLEEGLEVMALHITNSTFAVTNFEFLRTLTRKWLDDPTGAFAARLVTGLASLESAKPTFGIYQLYRYVAGSAGLTELFQKTDASEIWPRLKHDQDEETKEFNRRLDTFLKEYGYRSVLEGEMMMPSWAEDPSFIFSMIQNYLEAKELEAPEDILARQQKDREEAVAKAHRHLGLFKRLVFNRVLKETHTFIPGRENNKALLIMGISEVRMVVKGIAKKLLEKGIIKKEDDIYYVTMKEMLALCRGESLDVESIIPRRRNDYERNQAITLPETFAGRPQPSDPGGPEIPQTRVLKGLPVSPGRVTGPARVILDPRKDARIMEGEILVAPVTDAGWTPLFIMAKGLVVDIGGLLSHGSIVAREYGIPGVLNVMVGTKIIKTGQIITVDGAKGEVYLHDQ